MSRHESNDILEVIVAFIVIIILIYVFFGIVFPALCNAGLSALCGI